MKTKTNLKAGKEAVTFTYGALAIKYTQQNGN